MSERDDSWATFGQSLELCEETQAFNAFLCAGLRDDRASVAGRDGKSALDLEADHLSAMSAHLDAHRADLVAFRDVHHALFDRVEALEAALAGKGVDPARVTPLATVPATRGSVIPFAARASAVLRGVISRSDHRLVQTA